MYPEYVMNQAYEDTDVFVSLAKLKNHADCGVTLSLKNCFGNVPASIYGDDAGVDEPNESPTKGRAAVVHFGKRQPSKIAPACLQDADGTAGRHQYGRISRLARGGRSRGGAADPSADYRRRGIHRRRRRVRGFAACAW